MRDILFAMVGFLIDYLRWHYTTAFADILHVAKNFLRAVAELFSIRLLLKTFFKPIYRIRETYAGGLDFEGLFTMIITNTLMRLVGIFVRTLFIICGLIALAFLIAVIVCAYLVWLVAPLLGLVALVFGFIFLLS